MDPNFWHQRWEEGQIGFHKSEANPLIVAHFDALALSPRSRVYVPLCGKTKDIAWLLSRGHRVVGAELSRLAIDQLFEDLGVVPTITDVATVSGNALLRFAAPDIDVFVGDIFDVTAEALGPVDAVYDRAAFVALPDALRLEYSKHLATTTKNAPQLLITFEYDQTQVDGPPFSISATEVERHYEANYALKHVVELEVAGGVKGTAAMEHVWLLKQR